MNLLIIGVVLAVAVVAWAAREARRYGTTTGAELAGICTAAVDQTSRKEANKAKALTFLRERGEASNTELREHLSVASRTLVRYMDELEREGGAEQVGRAGKSVTYRAR